MKHQLKMFAREAYARALYHLGLHRLVDRLMPRRMTVLFGHCVEEASCNGFLPGDMKIRGDRLGSMLDWFRGRYDVEPVGKAFESVKENGKGRSLVCLSMDDGYRDNATALLPLLRERDLAATVFLESRPLDEKRVNWSHKYFWCISQGITAEALGRDYMLAAKQAEVCEALRRLFEEGGNDEYQVKRILKYEADPTERDAIVDSLFAKAGGDETALCEALYMSWDQARELRDAGFELGGHTVNHVIMSRVDTDVARSELGGCADSIERELGERPGIFAYPFGRRWDYTSESSELAQEAGFAVAVNTHAGTNDGASDPMQLRRIPIDDTAKMHLLVAEACGGFDLLRRFGVDLSE